MTLAQLQAQSLQPPLAPPGPGPGQAPAPPAQPPDIRDIVPPEPLPDYVQLALIAVLAVLSAIMIALLITWYLRERRRRRAAPPPPLSPVERARRDLEQLRSQLPALTPNELSVRTSNIIKTYFHERYDDPVLYETSEEFLRRDNVKKPLPQSKRKALAAFLQRCDLVKYSQYPEAARHAPPLLEEAFRIVEEPHAEPPPASVSAPDTAAAANG